MIFSWQKEAWTRLLDQRERLPHALLLAGPEGGGKSEFARSFAARLLCETATGRNFACGQCLPCRWFEAGNHPDFRMVEREANDDSEKSDAGEEPVVATKKRKSDQIRVDQVRALEDFLAIGTHRHGSRIVIIQPAEAMNHATANSILKVLEEPSVSTLFLLVTNNKEKILPTIRSRCQTLDFPRPPQAEALAWLRQIDSKRPNELLAHAGGMPLAAAAEAAIADRFDEFTRELAQIGRPGGPIAAASRMESWLKDNRDSETELDKRILTTWLQKWVVDLISVKMSGRVTYHKSLLPQLRAIASAAPASGLIDCYNQLLRARAVAQHPLNPRLFLEDMLARYARAVIARK